MSKNFVAYRRGQIMVPDPTGNAGLALNNTLRQLLYGLDGSARDVVVSSLAETQGFNHTYNEDGNSGLVMTDTSVMCRASIVFPYGGTMLRPVFGNHAIVGTVDTALADVTWTCSLEDVNGNIYDCTSNGSTSVTTQSGGHAVFDPVPLSIAPGGTLMIRYHLTMASGVKVSLAGGTSGVTILGYESGGTDKTRSGTVSLGSPPFGLYPVPLAVLGQLPFGTSSPASVLVVGDSISPPITMALRGVMPIHSIRESMQAYADFNGPHGRYRMAECGRTTHAIVQLGINDFRGQTSVTTADFQTMARKLWGTLKSNGNRIVAVTLTPFTPTSTDGWTSNGNQTKQSNDAARTGYNDWLRTLPDGIIGVVDWADICETSRNSGIWKANVTNDGTHPINIGSTSLTATTTAMIAAITPSLFT